MCNTSGKVMCNLPRNKAEVENLATKQSCQNFSCPWNPWHEALIGSFFFVYFKMAGDGRGRRLGCRDEE
jgi:hypothetical protein